MSDPGRDALWRNTCHNLADTLVRRATEQLPVAVRARYADEWREDLADIKATRRPSAVVRWAVEVLLRAPDVAAETRGDRSFAHGVLVFAVVALVFFLALSFACSGQDALYPLFP